MPNLIKKFKNKIIKTKTIGGLRIIGFPFLAFIITLIIGSVTLFMNPVIGLADNGEFDRIINSSGIYSLDKNNYNDYFIKKYGIYQYNNELEGSYTSTQNIFIKIAIVLSKVIYKNNIMDIRCMSWMFLLIEAIGIYLIVKVFTNNMDGNKQKLIITIATVIIFCDPGYLAYFNSFYGEAVNFSFLVLSIGLLLYSVNLKSNDVLYIFLFIVTFFVGIGTSKKLVFFTIVPILLLLRYSLVLVNDKKVKKAVIFISVLASIFALILYTIVPSTVGYVDRYHTMNRGILLNADDPKEVMNYFDIDEQYEVLKGTTFYDNVTLIDLQNESIFKEYFDKITTSKIISYYISHPSVLIRQIKLSFDNAYSIRPESLGNYEKMANKNPGEKAYLFSLYSSIKEKIFKGKTILSFIIGCYLFAFVFRHSKLKKKKEYKKMFNEEIFFFLFLIGITQIIISVFKSGDVDLSRNLFVYNLCFDFILVQQISLGIEK